jgi:hypothetical protein
MFAKSIKDCICVSIMTNNNSCKMNNKVCIDINDDICIEYILVAVGKKRPSETYLYPVH